MQYICVILFLVSLGAFGNRSSVTSQGLLWKLCCARALDASFGTYFLDLTLSGYFIVDPVTVTNQPHYLHLQATSAADSFSYVANIVQ